jgi:periplasmic copper chaperone A
VKRRPLIAAALVLPILPARRAAAHGVRAGDVLVDHPYAPPVAAGQREAPVYLRSVQNRGAAPERIVGARCGIAAGVDLPAGPIVLPPGPAIQMRHDGPPPMLLRDPAIALREGDRFSLVLQLERGGEHSVDVWIQTLRERKP